MQTGNASTPPKVLKSDRLALHHRHGGTGADVPQAQDRAAVGDDGHEVPFGGKIVHLAGVLDNRLGGKCRARRQVQQAQHVPVLDGNLAHDLELPVEAAVQLHCLFFLRQDLARRPRFDREAPLIDEMVHPIQDVGRVDLLAGLAGSHGGLGHRHGNRGGHLEVEDRRHNVIRGSFRFWHQCRQRLGGLDQDGRGHVAGLDVEEAAEHPGKHQGDIELVRKVRPAGGDDLGAGLLRLGGHDFWRGNGQGKDDGLLGHARNHGGGHEVCRREANQYVRAFEHIGQRAADVLGIGLPAISAFTQFMLVGRYLWMAPALSHTIRLRAPAARRRRATPTRPGPPR